MNSPFVCAEHCTFAGEYLGLMRNPEYNTDRAVFKVNDRICNKELISYFNRMRTEIAKEGTKDGVKVSFRPLLVVIVKHDILLANKHFVSSIFEVSRNEIAL